VLTQSFKVSIHIEAFSSWIFCAAYVFWKNHSTIWENAQFLPHCVQGRIGFAAGQMMDTAVEDESFPFPGCTLAAGQIVHLEDLGLKPVHLGVTAG
jgi:hypothetical protein